MPNTMYTPRGRWEYEMFTEVLAVTRYPEQMKFAPNHPNAFLQIGRVRDYDSSLARLIDTAARNLLQRVCTQGWEPVDAFDADSLWAKGRVRYEDGSGFRAGAGDAREIGPITVSIFCRRCKDKELSSEGQNLSSAFISPIQG